MGLVSSIEVAKITWERASKKESLGRAITPSLGKEEGTGGKSEAFIPEITDSKFWERILSCSLSTSKLIVSLGKLETISAITLPGTVISPSLSTFAPMEVETDTSR